MPFRARQSFFPPTLSRTSAITWTTKWKQEYKSLFHIPSSWKWQWKKRDLLCTGIKENDNHKIFHVSVPQRSFLGQARAAQRLWFCGFQTRTFSHLFNLKRSDALLSTATQVGGFHTTAQAQKVITNLTITISSLKPTLKCDLTQ